MRFEDENDFIMRMITELVRILFTLMLGKKYTQVELPPEQKYGVSGSKLSRWKELIDAGKINEGENILLEHMDHRNREDLAEALFFYEYAAKKGSDFLEEHQYSMEEVLDGLKQLAVQSGYGDFTDEFE